MRKIIIGLFTIISAWLLIPLYATEATTTPPFLLSVGPVVYGGITKDYQKDAIFKTDSGKEYGGGVVFQCNFNRYIGLKTGITYFKSYVTFKMPQVESDNSITMIDGKTAFKGLKYPLTLDFSYPFWRFSLGIGFGLAYINFTDSTMSATFMGQTMSTSLYKEVYYNQLAAIGQINAKFAVLDSVDLAVGAESNLYVTDLIKNKPTEGSKQSDHIYNYMITVGVMFRSYKYTWE